MNFSDTSGADTSGVAQVNGAAIHYDIAGAGFPLVLLHAGICDRRMWDDQVPALAEHFRVVRYDQRGFGDTPMPLGPFSHRADLEGCWRCWGWSARICWVARAAARWHWILPWRIQRRWQAWCWCAARPAAISRPSLCPSPPYGRR